MRGGGLMAAVTRSELSAYARVSVRGSSTVQYVSVKGQGRLGMHQF